MAQRSAEHSGDTPVRIALVGGGPRAIGVLERLGAQARTPQGAALLEGRTLRIDVVDPHMPGSGRIWRTDESPLLLMNSRAADVTIFTDETVQMDGPVQAGPSLAEWAQGIREGRIAAPTVGTDRLAEIEAITPTSFASRRTAALYLEWFLGEVLATLPGTVEVRVHRTTVTALRARDTDDAGTWQVRLEDRPALDADLVLLAAGHTDSRPGTSTHALSAFARRHGGVHVAPAQAGDADVDALAPGQDVIVRGMGLAFIDLLALVTEGRGGRFVADPAPGDPDRLRYEASGREPHLWAGSRRGIPYHSKVHEEAAPVGPLDLVHLTDAALREREDEHGQVDLHGDVLPLVAADIARALPTVPGGAEGRPLAPGEAPLDWLHDPLRELGADAGAEGTRRAVLDHIAADLRARTGHGPGAPEEPELPRLERTVEARVLFQLLLRLHGALVDLLPAHRVRGGARGDHPRWWHSLFSFVASGPPPHRLHQLLALERAGVVSFLGPGLRVEADEASGRFRARSASGVEVEAPALLDAFLPEQTLADSANPLLRDLVTGGAGRPAVGRDCEIAPGRLEVDEEHRVLAPDGTPHERLWAVGPWTSELPVGAFSRPRTNAPAFRRNDRVAAAMLREAAAVADSRDGERSGEAPAVACSALPARAASRPPRLGLLGPGKLGTALARTALRAGVEVVVASRQEPEQLRRRLPGSHLARVEQLRAEADVIVLAVPLHVALALDPASVAGTVLVDATNAWGPEDEAALAAVRSRVEGAEDWGTSELLAASLPGAQVVKTLNHIGYHDLEDHGRAAGAEDRRAIALATDHERAAELAAALLHRLGYDAVRAGSLADGRRFEPAGGLFSGWRTHAELTALGGASAPAADGAAEGAAPTSPRARVA